MPDKLKTAEELAKDLDSESTAHKGSGLTEAAYGILKILEAFKPDGASNSVLEDTAIHIATIYGATPSMWQEKPELKKTLRQQVRQKIHSQGFSDLKALAEEIEEFTLKNFAK